jgi:hypothetical protein
MGKLGIEIFSIDHTERLANGEELLEVFYTY